MQEIKIIDTPKQFFSTKLGTTRVSFNVMFNTVSERWTFDLYVEGELVLSGRRIILDTDLLYPFVEIDIGMIFCVDPEGQGNEPNRANLPSGIVRLFNATREEVLEIVESA